MGLTFASSGLKKNGVMVFKKCPGQDLSRKKPEEVVCNLPCPSCGAEVEFFFDDKIRICPHFGCADWCEAAEKCIGTTLYSKVKAGKKNKS
jgi:hypothetical protein